MNNYIIYIQKPKEFLLEYWNKLVTHGDNFIFKDIFQKHLSNGCFHNVVHYNDNMAMVCFSSDTSFHILLSEIKSKLEPDFKLFKIIQVSEFFSTDRELMTLLDKAWFKKENFTIIL